MSGKNLELFVSSICIAVVLSGCATVSAAGELRNSESESNQPTVMRLPKESRLNVSDRLDLIEEDDIATGEPAGTTLITENIKKNIASFVEPYGDKVAVSLVTMDTAEQFDVNGDKQFVSASMIKLLILSCFAEKIDDQVLTLDDVYYLSNSDIVGGTEHINAYPLGTALDYDELAESMIAYSDNTATNVLIDTLGMDAINAEAETLGLSATCLQRKMMSFGGTAENYMCANDAASLLSVFANERIGNKEICNKAINYLLLQTDNTALAKGIPEGVRMAHKTGSLNEYRHDGGIVYAEEPYILVVFTSLGQTDGNQFMEELSQLVYELLER